MPDLSTLLSKFLSALYAGTLFSNPFGASSVGVPVIQAAGASLAVTNAQAASIATCTVGAADGTFLIGGNVRVTTATTHSFNLECAYTDEANAAQVVTFQLIQSTGSAFASNGLIVNANGAVPYVAPVLTIRCKAATTITIRTNAAGTYTTVIYDAFGVIQQVA